MHTRTTAAALTGITLLATIVGCSSSGSDDKAAPVPTTTSPAAVTTTSAPTATPTPTPPTTYTIGQSWPWRSDQGATGSTTVLGYKQPVLKSDPPDESLGVPAGSQWGRLDIKICQKSGPSIEVSQDPWHVKFDDGSQADTTGLSGGDFPKPEFPMDGTVRAGDCTRGGIMFPIPKGQRPVGVVYAPESAPEPIYWAIPAK
ncbi:hypothetical protein [Streptomyces sp. NRRL F-5123]|uniref:hypothetical protein n=1 Tax=Streptomyces sp. NRRL F-5123 TaxID=1463856 RepID=UPI000693A8E6|nr:hypothetical protein [Streptomyces sp. NRRL F-5123]